MSDSTQGLFVARHYTSENVDVYSTVEWDSNRTAEIKDATGQTVFTQENMQFPASWSQLASKVVASKYFRGHVGQPNREWSLIGLIDRVADTITDWGDKGGYFNSDESVETFRGELKYILLHQYAAFNSPVWFNVGLRGNDKPQCSACFINGVEDSMESILDLAKTEGMLFKGGSGTGTNMSPLRAKGERLQVAGTASGPLSFMRGFDQFAGAIKSGGASRRAALMRLLDCDHPDIEAFVGCKMEEEKKAHALIDAGWSGMFNVDGGAYDSVQFQNANNSIRVTDDFMECVLNDDDFNLLARTDGHVMKTVKAKELLDKVSEAAWFCGDPGMQFTDTINKWHTVKNTDPIYASNPCCVTGDTYVFTSAGPKTIKELTEMYDSGREMPTAICWDTATHTPAFGQIEKAWVAGVNAQTLQIVTSSGMEIYATPEHRFLVRESEDSTNEQWRPASKLECGDLLRTWSTDTDQTDSDRRVTKLQRVVSVTPSPLKETVYDLQVRGFHNFVVSDKKSTDWTDGIVIHNSEFLHLDFTSCNLASINLMKYLKEDGSFDIAGYLHTIRILITAQEIIVGCAGYPSQKIEERTKAFRPLGLGYCNLGTLLMASGLPYDSDEGRSYAACLTAILTGEAYAQSAQISAKCGGPFEGYNDNILPMLGVIALHCESVEDIDDMDKVYLQKLKSTARYAWRNAYDLGEDYGYRNSQATVLAPTGTIGFMLDCFTGDTLVATADGRNAVSFKTLAEEGKNVLVYASENGSTVIKMMRNPRLIRKNSELVKVTLDDGTFVRCTPDHRFMLRNGEYVLAKDLQFGHSLMRFDSVVMEMSGCQRRKIWMGPERGGNRGKGNMWQAQYRIFGNYLYPQYDGRSGGLLHHKDGNELNDTHDNLYLCKDISEHQKLHWEMLSPEERSQMLKDRHASMTPEEKKESHRKRLETEGPEGIQKRIVKTIANRDPEQFSQANKDAWAKQTPEQKRARGVKSWETRRSNQAAAVHNHKVVSVEPDGYEDTYCGEVDDVHNFAIITTPVSDTRTDTMSGIVVHNCDSTGVEPDIALVKYKNLVGGGMIKITNQSVPKALLKLGYTEDQIKKVVDYITEHDTIEGAPGLFREHLAIFDCAFKARNGTRTITPQGHVDMMAAVQPFLSGAISKTVNMPESATPDDIREAYIYAWKKGIKAVAIYRDGSKRTQPLTTSSDNQNDGKKVKEVFLDKGNPPIVYASKTEPALSVEVSNPNYLTHTPLSHQIDGKFPDEKRQYNTHLQVLESMGEPEEEYVPKRSQELGIIPQTSAASQDTEPEEDYIPETCEDTGWTVEPKEDTPEYPKYIKWQDEQYAKVIDTSNPLYQSLLKYAPDFSGKTNREKHIAMKDLKRVMGGKDFIQLIVESCPENSDKVLDQLNANIPPKPKSTYVYSDHEDNVGEMDPTVPARPTYVNEEVLKDTETRYTHDMTVLESMLEPGQSRQSDATYPFNPDIQYGKSELSGGVISAQTDLNDLLKPITPKETSDSNEKLNEQSLERLQTSVLKVERSPSRKKLADERQAITHKFSIAGHEGYITVGLYENGQPGEIFITMNKEGSTLSGLMDVFATSISLGLQYGVPLDVYIKKFTHVRFEPSGYTQNQDIRIAKSVVDYIFRWLQLKFVPPISGQTEDPEPLVESGYVAGTEIKAGESVGTRQDGLVYPVLSPSVPIVSDQGPEIVTLPKDGKIVHHAPSSPEKEVNVKINIHTSDPKAFGASIGETLGRQLNQLHNKVSAVDKAIKSGQTYPEMAFVMDEATKIPAEHWEGLEKSFQNQSDAPPCMECGQIMIRSGACYKCLNCGTTSGCS